MLYAKELIHLHNFVFGHFFSGHELEHLLRMLLLKFRLLLCLHNII